MQNYQTLYNEDHPIHGTTNVEYFFEQPLTLPLASAIRQLAIPEQNVILPTAATSAVTLPAIKISAPEMAARDGGTGATNAEMQAYRRQGKFSR